MTESESGALAGKTALVTGGGGGIGSAICRRLAAEGARVVITFRMNERRANALAAELPGTGHMTQRVIVEATSSLRVCAEMISSECGSLDILVNNAGITKPVPHDDLDGLEDELIDKIFKVNFRGAFAAVRLMRPLMLAAEEGAVVINISSIAGRTGVGSNVAYCASKAAMDSMTRSLARALAPQIRVLSVSPGFVDGEYARRMPPELLIEQAAKTPLDRIATADDVADAVYAAIVQLRFSTGDIIGVDGGRRLG